MNFVDPELLPTGWTIASLSEIAEINPRPCRAPVDDSTEVNFVPMRAVEAEGRGLTKPEVRTYGEVKKGYTSFLSGDVITAKITPCMENGKTTVVPSLPHELSFGSTEFHVVRPKLGVPQKWISQFLLQHKVRRLAQRQMSGAVGQMRVPQSFLEELKIPVAPVNEQQRISDELDELQSDLDAGVEALNSAHAKLVLYRASVLKAAVQGDLTAEWRNEHPNVEPASVLLQRILKERRQRWEEDQLRKFKDNDKAPPTNWKSKYNEPVAPDITNLPALPKGWCWTSVDQITETKGGLQKTPDRVPKVHHYPYLRVANVLRGRLDLSEISRFELTAAELDRLRLQAGDLLVVEGNGSRTEIGRCAIWSGEIKDCVHQNHIIRLRPFQGVVSNYMNSFLNSPVGQDVIQQVASSTSGLYTLSVSKIQHCAIPLAPTAEQEEICQLIAEQVSIIEHVETDLSTKAAAALSLRQSILNHAFGGKLVPQNPNDEPANVVLEKIAGEREACAKFKNMDRKKRGTGRRRKQTQ